ncbi:MAG: AraC family transcriptional regulator ligand-binding domain-containing protein, partial [Deltaproteobacteria bacterium]|nr:AraC family transcriptional regulator ligand-binding domain-containing protein [Deltaproteobacteria bacterium]
MDRAIVPIVYSAEFVALLAEEGVSAGDVLRGTGITRRRLRDADDLITHPQQLRVYENALALSPKPGLGFRLGARFKPGHHGVLGHAILCAESGRDVLRIVGHYSRIRGFLLDFRFREEGGVAILSAHEILPLGPIHQVAVEELLAMFGSRRSGARSFVQPTEIRIDYRAPAHRARYEALYDCPIRFGSDALEFRFFGKALDVPREMSNAEMVRICEERCQAILERLGSGGHIVDRVRSHLVAPPRGFELDAVASRMAMTPRTLRRRLKVRWRRSRACSAMRMLPTSTAPFGNGSVTHRAAIAASGQVAHRDSWPAPAEQRRGAARAFHRGAFARQRSSSEIHPVIAPPEFKSIREHVSCLGDVGFWGPYVAEILERHDLGGAERKPVAGFNPTYPTFLCGDVVVKLFGYSRAWRKSHAAESAALALVATNPEIAAPRLLAEGRLVDNLDAPWPYLATTRMSGVSWRDAELST